MRYLINFQVQFYKTPSVNIVNKRSTYTVSDKEQVYHNLKDIDSVYEWFEIFFNANPCELFVDYLDIKKDIDINLSRLKIGRITDSKTGKYKTY